MGITFHNLDLAYKENITVSRLNTILFVHLINFINRFGFLLRENDGG